MQLKNQICFYLVKVPAVLPLALCPPSQSETDAAVDVRTGGGGIIFVLLLLFLLVFSVGFAISCGDRKLNSHETKHYFFPSAMPGTQQTLAIGHSLPSGWTDPPQWEEEHRDALELILGFGKLG